MGQLDITFRRLLRSAPRPILRLAFPRRRRLEPIRWPVDPSLDRSRQRTGDNLFRVRDGNSEAAVHVEIEREWRSEIERRLFEYASAAVLETELRVSSIVLLLRRGGRPPRVTGVYRIRGISGNAFIFRYHVVPLWQLDARQMRARLGPAGAPFCVAMSGADEELVRSLAAEVRTTKSLTQRERKATMRLLYLVTAVILGDETAERIFHMEWISQDPNIQALVRRWEDKGRDKGRVEEARSILYRVLGLRSLPITPDVRARIDGEADIARLEAWNDAAISAATIGDVFRQPAPAGPGARSSRRGGDRRARRTRRAP